ncbi:uncharacterized protein LOC106673740 [Cimex lectularius]|uniref:Uncharacterized protein n=1 Tax=Cimex lectularius TaxID=79782 RepID=A0A8I6SCR7_CIMLE|nr:uncharacterized protein LOC106673740 [Cimex lectularius]
MESGKEKELASEETIFGYTPEPFFDNQFVHPAEEGSHSPEQKEENGKSECDDIFQRLKRRIELAQRKPEVPETITIDDSDEDSTCPVWKPGQYLNKIRQREIISRMKLSMMNRSFETNVKMLKKKILSAVKSGPKPGNVNCQLIKLPNGKIIKFRVHPKQ